MARNGMVARPGLLLIAAALVALPAPPARASGLWMYERGTPEVGTANAGVAARAQDASIAASNPAGMTRLDRPEVMSGIQPIILNVHFSPDAGTTTSGPKGDADGVIPAATLYYVQPLSNNWRFGVSVGSYFGLGVKFEDDWVGRYYVRESALLTANIMPTIAYRVNDWLSIGAGPVFQYAYLKNKVAVNNLGPADGELEFKDSSFGIGGAVGVLVEPRKGTRFGLTYVSPVEQEFKDTPEFRDLGPVNATLAERVGEIKIKMTFPQQVMFSAYHEVTPNWAVMGNVGWQNWTKFGYTGISVANTVGPSIETTKNASYDDTYHIAVGTHYRFHPQWRVTAGFAYDSSPAGDADRTLALPLDRQLRYSAGVIWDWSDRITFGLAYTFIDGGKASVHQTRGPLAGTISGEFSSNYYHVIALSVAARV
jgi:long-chain fatty acid transport protein